MKALLTAAFLLLIGFVFITMSGGLSGCKPSDPVVQHDTIVTLPPVVIIKDSVNHIKKIEEDYYQSFPGFYSRTKDFTFHYDARNRVSFIGIRYYYSLSVSDSFTTQFFYNNNSLRPYQIILPDFVMSQPGRPSYYDTIRLSYKNDSIPIMDSGTHLVYNDVTIQPEYKPLKRIFQYPDNKTVLTHWYGSLRATDNLSLIRKDSISYNSTGTANFIKTNFYDGVNLPQGYAVANNFSYSGFINPLSVLNISGSIYAYIYAPVRKEILGNIYHPVIHNGSFLPYYLDFCNTLLPTSFAFSGYYNDGSLIGSGAINVTIQITPWPKRSTYPETVISNAPNGDKVRQKYSYY